jgi:hypothetical protein
MSDSVAVRVQGLDDANRALTIARLAAGRANKGEFTAHELDDLFRALGLPAPSKAGNAIASMKRREWVRPGTARGSWKMTPVGRATADSLLSGMDLAALEAEAVAGNGSLLGGTVHAVVPPSLAPPKLLNPLRGFLDSHPFETNVFAMTRFPDGGSKTDPVRESIEVAREVCKAHGLELHLASDRAMDDELWTNVAAHMWASRYGIAFFEDRVGRGLNYNLTIEVGSMLMTGRRCALLKDSTVAKLPTDFVGQIYKDIDLDDISSTQNAIHIWIRDDLSLGSCDKCPR